VVRERGCTTRHLWLAIENQFLDNREQRTLHLDVVFHTFVQGDLSVNEYYRKFKAKADGLADLGAPIEDLILVLNILRGLNQRFEHVGSIIRRYSPFLNFLKVRDDLLLEKIHIDSTGPSAAPTTLYTNAASPAAKPPSSTPSRPPNGGNGGTGGNRTITTTKTTIAVMAAATTARTAIAVEVVVALLARPPPPLVPTVGPTHRGRPTATRGRST
jgi:hypothetical protein